MNINEIIKILKSNHELYEVITKAGKKLTGAINGPFAGDPDTKLEDYLEDYIYVIDANETNTNTRVYTKEIEKMEGV
jgi:hypothetical protein